MLKSREKSIKFSYRFSKTITLHLCQKLQCIDYPRFTIFRPFLPNARRASKSAILQIAQFYTIFRIAHRSPMQRGGYLLNPAAHQPAAKSPRAPRSAALTPISKAVCANREALYGVEICTIRRIKMTVRQKNMALGDTTNHFFSYLCYVFGTQSLRGRGGCGECKCHNEADRIELHKQTNKLKLSNND